MTIGAAWNIDNPKKPFAEFDAHADIKIPMGFDDWLTELGVIYFAHDVTALSPLECASPGTYSSGTTLIRMRLAPAALFTPGVKYPFTIRLRGADGTTQDDRTLFLKVLQR